MARDPETGLYALRMPRKGAKWSRSLKSLAAVCERARTEIEGPMFIDYVDWPSKENDDA